MAFKFQKWILTFMRFHKTLLAFKTPNRGIYVAEVLGVLNPGSHCTGSDRRSSYMKNAQKSVG